MSYILEALKRSQQERELGQVPTLEASGIFAADQESTPSAHWGLLAVGLAALAVVIALYAAFREPVTLAPPPPVTLPASPDAAVGRLSPGERATQPAAGVSAPPAPAQSQAAPAVPLVEAPPPARPPGYGAYEGDVPASADNFDADYDPELELALRRQLEAEESRAEAVRSQPASRKTPIPDDLVEDIEAFKQQIRREQGIPPPDDARQRARIQGDPTRLRLSATQQAQVPGYLMTAHVYDPEAAKRFVVINTLKYREGQETREGLWIERILPEGAVLSYLGNPFFVHR